MEYLQEYAKERKQLLTFQAGTIKALDGMRLEVLGAPFGGHLNGKDADGEFFSDKTDFMLSEGDKRPVIYYHGKTPRGSNMLHPEVIGTAEYVRKDERGLWFEVVLNQGSELAARVWQAAKEGFARASSGTIGYLKRLAEKTGEILTWPLAELSLFDTGNGRQPANQLAVVNVKALFENAGIDYPESFLESGELKETGEKEPERFIVIHKKWSKSHD